MSDIKIIELNVNSVVSLKRRYYLNEILKEKKPDIVLLCETHLSKKFKLSFKDYRMIRKDRTERKKGGCAILIKETMKYKNVNLIGLTTLEHCAIKVEDKTSREDIIVISVYNHSGTNAIDTDLSKIFAQLGRSKVIIGGDFNAKHRSWNDITENMSGKTLRKWLDNDGLQRNINHLTTFSPTRENAYLDCYLASAGFNIKYNSRHPLFLEIFPTFSDHHGVILNIGGGSFTEEELKTINDFKNTDIPEFQRKITNGINMLQLEDSRNLTNEEIVEGLENLNYIIKNTIDETVPKIQIKQKGLIKLNQQTLDLIKFKKKLRRRLHRTGDLSVKPLIRNLDIIIQEQIRITHNKFWESKMKMIKLNKDTFKQIKNIVGASSHQKMPPLLVNGTEIEEDVEKANEIAEHWEHVYTPLITTDNETLLRVNNTVQEIKEDTAPLFHFNAEANSLKNNRIEDANYKMFMSMEDLNIILKSRNNKQSAGNDLMPMSLLKKIPVEAKEYLLILYNNIINNAFYPPKWKEAVLAPLLKPGKNAVDPASYRMIALLSNLSKVFEVFLQWKISEHLEEKEIFKDWQFGFRKGHSTTHALTTFTAEVTNQLNRRFGTIAVSLDVEKAFDKTWQEGVIFKMKQLEFPAQICKIVASYLENRTFKVKVEDKMSESRTIRAGVPQGSVLGPTLYNIFTSDIPEPEDCKTKILAYADDILVFASSPRLKIAAKLINKYLEEYKTYCDKWNLKINIDKCEAIKITKPSSYKSHKNYTPEIKWGDEQIKNVRIMKYLGLSYKENFNFNQHIKNSIKKCNATIALYNKAINTKSALTNRIKVIFYLQVLRPMISYGFPAWFFIPPTQMEELRKLERKILRLATGLTRKDDGKYFKNQEVYDASKIHRIDKFLVQGTIKFTSKLENMDNGIIQQILSREVTLQDKNYNIGHMSLLTNQLFEGKKVTYFNGGYSGAQYEG
jgi:exonuclease III